MMTKQQAEAAFYAARAAVYAADPTSEQDVMGARLLIKLAEQAIAEATKAENNDA